MKMTGCYVLCYYFPEFVRTATLLQALKRSKNLVLYEALNTTRGWLRYWQTLSRLLVIRLRYDPDFYILGFRGYELFWPVRLITWKRPLLFDHMMSPYDSLVNEKKRIRSNSLLAKIIYRYEKGVLNHADRILTDTAMHRQYFAGLFGIDKEKIHSIHVAADEKIFTPCSARIAPAGGYSPEKPFHVFFYGSFLPLHGTDVILRAAALLSHLPVHFTLVGGHKQDLSQFYALQRQLNLQNVTHIPWIDYLELPERACHAHLCLGGPFGNTGQARRVITGKTFQFLALGRPTVVGHVEPNEYFTHQYNCLLVKQGNPTDLAAAIEWSVNHHAKLPAIGKRGRELYERSFSITVVEQEVATILQNALLPAQIPI